jgi:DNA-binding response OmpR family regulator
MNVAVTSRRTEHGAEASSEPVVSLQSSEMARILIAEDFREISDLMMRILARDGYEIDVVPDGSMAIEKLRTESYDAILLDFMMPVASGEDVLTWIAAHRPEIATACVIIVTAAARELKLFDKLRVYATLQKPFEIDDLRDTVRQCVSDRGAPASDEASSTTPE